MKTFLTIAEQINSIKNQLLDLEHFSIKAIHVDDSLNKNGVNLLRNLLVLVERTNVEFSEIADIIDDGEG